MAWNLERFFNSLESMFKPFVFDTETSLIGDKSIYAYPPDFVLAVTKHNHHVNYHISKKDLLIYVAGMHSDRIIVGHNLAFDMVQLGFTHATIPENLFWWDTAIFEYEYSGQDNTFPSLQDTVDKYFPGESKDETVSEMIKASIDPKDIPIELLIKYCEQDVILTEKVFYKQIELFRKIPKTRQNLILERMKFRVATHLMSMNGMHMDSVKLSDDSQILDAEVDNLRKDIILEMSKNMPHRLVSDINPNSNQQLAACIYGGEYEYDTYVNIGTYKTGAKAGTTKYKREVKKAPVLNPIYPSTSLKSVDEATLKSLPVKDRLIDLVLEYRTLSKELNTYFIGYPAAACIDASTLDTVVHSEYKHTITPTGRISSTKPNLQNLTRD